MLVDRLRAQVFVNNWPWSFTPTWSLSLPQPPSSLRLSVGNRQSGCVVTSSIPGYDLYSCFRFSIILANHQLIPAALPKPQLPPQSSLCMFRFHPHRAPFSNSQWKACILARRLYQETVEYQSGNIIWRVARCKEKAWSKRSARNVSCNILTKRWSEGEERSYALRILLENDWAWKRGRVVVGTDRHISPYLCFGSKRQNDLTSQAKWLCHACCQWWESDAQSVR